MLPLSSPPARRAWRAPLLSAVLIASLLAPAAASAQPVPTAPGAPAAGAATTPRPPMPPGMPQAGAMLPYPPPPMWAPPPPYWDSAPSTPPPSPPARSEGMVAGGIVLATLGAIWGVGGVALLIDSGQDEYDYSNYECFDEFCNGPPAMDKTASLVGGVAMLIGGAVAGGVGAWLVVSGNKPEERRPGAALVPQVQVGPTGGSLTWKF